MNQQVNGSFDTQSRSVDWCLFASIWRSCFERVCYNGQHLRRRQSKAVSAKRLTAVEYVPRNYCKPHCCNLFARWRRGRAWKWRRVSYQKRLQNSKLDRHINACKSLTRPSGLSLLKYTQSTKLYTLKAEIKRQDIRPKQTRTQQCTFAPYTRRATSVQRSGKKDRQ